MSLANKPACCMPLMNSDLCGPAGYTLFLFFPAFLLPATMSAVKPVMVMKRSLPVGVCNVDKSASLCVHNHPNKAAV